MSPPASTQPWYPAFLEGPPRPTPRLKGRKPKYSRSEGNLSKSDSYISETTVAIASRQENSPRRITALRINGYLEVACSLLLVVFPTGPAIEAPSLYAGICLACKTCMQRQRQTLSSVPNFGGASRYALGTVHMSM